VKGSVCTFLHDQAALPRDVAAAVRLRDYVADKGGRLPANRMGEVYRLYPEVKDLIEGKIRKFCEMHPELLTFSMDDGAGSVLVVPISTGAQLIAKKKATAVTAPAASGATHANHALQLAAFVAAAWPRASWQISTCCTLRPRSP